MAKQSAVEWEHMRKIDLNCPHCGRSLRLGVAIEDGGGAGFLVPMSAEERERRWLEAAPEAVQAFFRECETAGVIESLRIAVKGVPSASQPENIMRFLLSLGKCLMPWREPQGEHLLVEQFPGPPLALWQANGIVVVVQKGRMVGVVAKETLVDAAAQSASRANGPVPDFTREWIRTRFGYVTSPMLFDEFRKKNLGAWDAVTRSKA